MLSQMCVACVLRGVWMHCLMLLILTSSPQDGLDRILMLRVTYSRTRTSSGGHAVILFNQHNIISAHLIRCTLTDL